MPELWEIFDGYIDCDRAGDIEGQGIREVVSKKVIVDPTVNWRVLNQAVVAHNKAIGYMQQHMRNLIEQ